MVIITALLHLFFIIAGFYFFVRFIRGGSFGALAISVLLQLFAIATGVLFYKKFHPQGDFQTIGISVVLQFIAIGVAIHSFTKQLVSRRDKNDRDQRNTSNHRHRCGVLLLRRISQLYPIPQMEEKMSTKKQHQARLNPVGRPTDVAIQTSVGYNTETKKVTLNYSRNLNNVSFPANEAVAFAQAIVRAAKAIDPDCAEGASW